MRGMRLGMIGLGRMGANMSLRLMRGGHAIAAFDPDPKPRAELAAHGAAAAESLAALVTSLPAPRVVWVMVPSGDITEATLVQLRSLLASGDTVIEGGNSNYKDTQRRSQEFAALGIHYVDCGTSGGIWGLAEGYSLMIGGDADAVETLRPIFETL